MMAARGVCDVNASENSNREGEEPQSRNIRHDDGPKRGKSKRLTRHRTTTDISIPLIVILKFVSCRTREAIGLAIEVPTMYVTPSWDDKLAIQALLSKLC
jgi:hypothetical protein